MINGNTKSFEFFIYKKQINKINCSLKEDELNNRKSFEIIYLSKKKKIYQKKQKFQIIKLKIMKNIIVLIEYDLIY